MTDCSPYLMYAATYRECVIAVTETRNVTARLGRAEMRALRVSRTLAWCRPWPAWSPGQQPGAGSPRLFPMRKRRDSSGPTPFPPVNRGIVMEWLGLCEPVESLICLHYAGPDAAGVACGRALDDHARSRETTRSVVRTWVRGQRAVSPGSAAGARSPPGCWRSAAWPSSAPRLAPRRSRPWLRSRPRSISSRRSTTRSSEQLDQASEQLSSAQTRLTQVRAAVDHANAQFQAERNGRGPDGRGDLRGHRRDLDGGVLTSANPSVILQQGSLLRSCPATGTRRPRSCSPTPAS